MRRKPLAAIACLAALHAWQAPPPPERPAIRTYERNKAIPPGGGGHATAPGPAPARRSPADDLREAGEIGARLDFQEVALFPGKTFFGGPEKEHILESGGAGAALLDYDGDGLLDVYLVNGVELTAGKQAVRHRNFLYRNLGGWKFEEVAKRAGVDAAAWGAGVCAGDYDGDGRIDLYVTNYGTNLLFRNNGAGAFTEAGREAGVDHRGWSTGCAFFDADGDGRLDLYVANYVDARWDEVLSAKRTLLWRGGPAVMAGPAGLRPGADVFYHNEGHGRFRDRTAWLGLSAPDSAYGFGVLATDYNGDGRVDLYVANDTNANYLFRNRGNGRFEEVGLASGAALSADGRAQAGMGVDAADFDGDGRLDLVVTNFAHDYNTLYRNLGGGQFEDASEEAGLRSRTFDQLSWGVASLDANLDGLPDLFFANGHIYPQVDRFPDLGESFRQENQLLLNRGGRFVDVSGAAGSGLLLRKSHRGLAVGDLDNDGRPDLVITSMDDAPTVLRNRTASAHHWVVIELRCDGPNAFCIGAAVTVDAGGKRQMREIRSGGSYVSQNDLRMHYGLGSYAGKITVTARLPGGLERTWSGVETGRIVQLRLPGR